MSEAPTHRIRDELIELRSDQPALAQSLLERVSSLHRRALVETIDRVCSQLSPGDRVHRIETLEFELGPIPVDEFEAEFVRRFEPALRSALTRAIRDLDKRDAAAGPAARGAAIELLELFLATGNLPWWADRSRPGLIAAQLDEAAARHPRALQRLLARCIGSPRPEQLRRLVQQLDDHALAELVELLAGSEARTLAALARSLVLLVRAATPGHASARVTVWTAVLRGSGAASSGADTGRLGEHVDMTLLELARALGVSTPVLCDELLAFVERGDHDCPASLRSAIERGATTPTHAPTREADPPEASASAATRDDARAHPPSASAAAQPDTTAHELAAWLDSWRDGALRELAVCLRAVARSQPLAITDNNQPTTELLSRLTEQALRDGSLSRATLRQALTQLHGQGELERALLQAVERAALAHRTPTPEPRPPADATPRLDQLHVDDAGCVIAWPFLDRLFTRLELLDRNTFVSPAAANRAVALLHWLASEDPDPPEYALPLAKLLCGLAPDAPFELESALEPPELQESERMLDALIAHATILRDMSVADLRASFLRRAGILSTRDGGWLLQVERRSHDVVLDRFPWTWTWVRLPWMSAPLRVEW